MAITAIWICLALKASELFSLQTEAQFKLKEDIALKLMAKDLDDNSIAEVTGLSVLHVRSLRN